MSGHEKSTRDIQRLIDDSSLGTPAAKRHIENAPCGIKHNQRLLDEVHDYELSQRLQATLEPTVACDCACYRCRPHSGMGHCYGIYCQSG